MKRILVAGRKNKQKELCIYNGHIKFDWHFRMSENWRRMRAPKFDSNFRICDINFNSRYLRFLKIKIV